MTQPRPPSLPPEEVDEFDPNPPLPDLEEIVKEPRRLDLIDLTPYFDGTLEPIRPTIAEVLPGLHLFYAGRTNSIHGEPSVGKTNILICAANAHLEAGGSVLFIDPEDTPHGVGVRARLLGVTRANIGRFHYLQNPTPEDYALAHEWAAAHRPGMVIIDGLAEALAAEGKDENSPADVLGFFRDRTRPFADCGAVVVIADHVVKGEGNKRFARGSGAKLGSYNGAVYEVTLGESYSPTKEGFVRLKVAKDRNGGVGAMGAMVAELHLSPSPNGQTITWWETPPEPGSFRPTALMEKVIKHLQIYGEATKTDLRGLGNSDWIDKAVEILLEDGDLELQRVGKKHIFRARSANSK